VEERTHELTQAKKRLEKSLADLKASQEQLIQTARFHAMGEATTAVAHDLADPLTIIVSLAHSLAKEVTTEGRAKAQLQQISEAALCCQRLVESLLTFVDTKASINAMVYHLSEILLPGRFSESCAKSMANPR
jgi:two-component system NtrC family sensor kinase